MFHSHPITVKGIFFLLPRNSPKTTMRVSQGNTISLECPVLSHVPHTKGKKSDPVNSTPARAISQSWLNKDSSNRGANRDGQHLLLASGPSLALRIPPLISGPRNHLRTSAHMKRPLKHMQRVRKTHTHAERKRVQTNKQGRDWPRCIGAKAD